VVIDFSFLSEGTYEAEIFWDGMNADRDATDYKREKIQLTRNDRKTIRLSSGGGWAARIYKIK
jgi:alpha-glucosidase